jgi:peptidoglycan/xylan/chitin deacetylase (PgdA/CDA1 family)
MKATYLTLMQILGGERRLLERVKSSGQPLILNLHQVSPHPNPYWNPMPPEHFEELLGWLSRRFQFISLGESPTGTKPGVVLSFDDGYADFLEYAMPALERYGIRANQNIIPESVESGRPIWNVRMYDFLRAAPRSLINTIRIPGLEKKLAGDDDLSKMRHGLALSRFLKNRARAEREPLFADIERAMRELGDYPRTRMMTLDQVQEAAAHHRIGVHSYSHESMAYESDEFFVNDTGRCAAFFRGCLHLSLDTYAFPNGSYRPSHIEMLRACGFRHILLVDEQFPECRSADVHTRITLSGESPRELHFQALGHKAGRR